MTKAFARCDHPRVIRTADPRVDLIAQFEGRKRALLSGEHFTAEPLSKDHRDDITRWIFDLDEALAFLKGIPNGRIHSEADRGLVAVRVHEAQGWEADPHQAQRSKGAEVQEVRLREGLRNYQQAIESLIAIHRMVIGSVPVTDAKQADGTSRSAAPKDTHTSVTQKNAGPQ